MGKRTGVFNGGSDFVGAFLLGLLQVAAGAL